MLESSRSISFKQTKVNFINQGSTKVSSRSRYFHSSGVKDSCLFIQFAFARGLHVHTVGMNKQARSGSLFQTRKKNSEFPTQWKQPSKVLIFTKVVMMTGLCVWKICIFSGCHCLLSHATKFFAGSKPNYPIVGCSGVVQKKRCNCGWQPELQLKIFVKFFPSFWKCNLKLCKNGDGFSCDESVTFFKNLDDSWVFIMQEFSVFLR